jgi:hypothetical protein
MKESINRRKNQQEKGQKKGPQLPAQPADVRSNVLAALDDKLDHLPFVAAIRTFWRNFQEMRDWWPVLIPLMIWVGWRTYHAERREIRRRNENRNQTRQGDSEPQSPGSEKKARKGCKSNEPRPSGSRQKAG